MTPSREQELFDQALDLAPAERAAFVARASGGDAALRERVLALLAAHELGVGEPGLDGRWHTYAGG